MLRVCICRCPSVDTWFPCNHFYPRPNSMKFYHNDPCYNIEFGKFENGGPTFTLLQTRSPKGLKKVFQFTFNHFHEILT